MIGTLNPYAWADGKVIEGTHKGEVIRVAHGVRRALLTSHAEPVTMEQGLNPNAFGCGDVTEHIYAVVWIHNIEVNEYYAELYEVVADYQGDAIPSGPAYARIAGVQ